MNSKITSYVLVIFLIIALIFAFYTIDRAKKVDAQNKELQTKYEEAIIDAEDAAQREEKLKEELEKALKDSEMHRKQAEEALNQLQKKKGK